MNFFAGIGMLLKFVCVYGFKSGKINGCVSMERTKNCFLLLHFCTHDGFCKRYCPIADYDEVFGGLPLDWLGQEGYLLSNEVCLCKMDLETCCLNLCCKITTHILTVTLAQELVDNVTLMESR